MKLYLFDENEIITFNLPDKKIGNFWVTDEDGMNIININANNDNWIISNGKNSKIISDGKYLNEVVLELKKSYFVEKNDKRYLFFVDNIIDNTFISYNSNPGHDIKISGNNDASVFVNNIMFKDLLIVLNYNNGLWNVKTSNNFPLYINNSLVKNDNIFVNNGDVLNIYGLKVVFVFNILFINNPFDNLSINSNSLSVINMNVNDDVIDEDLIDKPLYNDDDYFYKSPRLRRSIETFDMNIDSPPVKENDRSIPMIYTLGPMLTMGASSIVNITDTMSRIGSGERSLSDSMPSLIVSSAMLCSMLLWPFLTKRYEKMQKKKNEEKRQSKYIQYIGEKKKELQNEYNSQMQILEENLLSSDICYDVILNKKRTLWERKIDQSDFLTVRVGKGRIPFDAKINYHTSDFSMDDDNLIKKLNELVAEYSFINDVPIGYSFSENMITAINGLDSKVLYFTYNMILQMMAYHSYDNLKFVIFTNEKNRNKWNFLNDSLYCFSDDRSIRFFCDKSDEMVEISNYLEKIFDYRKNIAENKKNTFMLFNSYYLIIIDDIDLARKINIVDNVLKENNNLGFSLVILENRLSKLPSQCTNFISIGDKNSGILKNDALSNTQIRFIDEIKYDYDMLRCSYILSNIPLYVENSRYKMPDKLTFLELFGVGQVEQLNALNRWKQNDPTKSLKASIGLNENGDICSLDLHEKFHGPHGLIAGMTGSGKSEFIITYILSMAINYSPEEVSFVLIDYKGGGLTGAFESKEYGVKLPHIVGTITNLDKSEIKRALSSIDSELRRRQQKFNDVRKNTGESTIDIYKYQKMYRDGQVEEPMPHLIIVCDEFAELKSQQPDFMDDLISIARLGRSLGIHLILSTQKPSGVVDAQIWSNSKFKICLKVQDKSDSMEMIKRPDAAELKNVGRFYLQVGYNEYFSLGQSAWAGASYFPSKEFKKQIDKNIYFVDNVGLVYKSIDNIYNRKNLKSNGEELSNVLRYLINVSSSLDLKLRPLWMDRISSVIYLSNLYKKYNYVKEKYYINPVIGEYDDPYEQKQDILTLPITKNGNVMVYGMSDSGRDEFLESLTYSIITTYDTKEVNLYLVDFGAETLINFIDAPQVGDVILNNDEEKLENFVKLLNSEMSRRKKQFLSYNGNYIDYVKMSGNTVPNILVFINMVEIFNDVYIDLFDKLFPVIRDGSKYGINFVFTTTNQYSVRFKVSQSCKQFLCLQLTNDVEYREILGNTNGILPSKYLGRGLVKLDKICEFQTAFITSDDKKINTIKETINTLNNNNICRARKVPMMPDVIKLNNFVSVYKGIDSIPLGISKEDLNLVTYDYSKNVVNLVVSNEIDNTKSFIKNYLKVLELNNNFNKLVIDASNYFDEFNYNINLVNSKFDEFIDSLKKMDDEIQNILETNNYNIKCLKNMKDYLYVVVGFEKFYSKLDDEHKKIFKEILFHNKESRKIHFVFVDIPSAFKKYEYEDWYKNCFDLDDGLWIGYGATQQFVIKLSIQLTKYSNIENDYGVLIKNGIPQIVRLINEIK